MIRTFCTNKIRETEELSSSLWGFSPVDGEHAGEIYPVMVPCCWENLPGFSAWRGVGCFTRYFQAEGNVRLIFKGVSHTAEIYVDGDFVGSHYNAFTPFFIELTDLEAGTHKLEVYADNRFSEESALHVPNDYMSYGGITRGVVLESVTAPPWSSATRRTSGSPRPLRYPTEADLLENWKAILLKIGRAHV